MPDVFGDQVHINDAFVDHLAIHHSRDNRLSFLPWILFTVSDTSQNQAVVVRISITSSVVERLLW